MKRPFHPKRIPLFILSAGALGFILRAWLFIGGIDEKGLLLSDHPANALLMILTAITLPVLFLYLRRLIGIPPYQKLFQPAIPAAVGCGVAALGILITECIALSAQTDNVSVISFLLGLLAAGCLGFSAFCRMRGIRPKVYVHGGVAVYLMIHLVAQYRQWSAEPQLQAYCFQLLASVFLMLAAYHRTALDMLSGSRRWYVFFNYGALFFCCLALYGENWLFYLSMAVLCATDRCSLKPVRPGRTMQLPKNVMYCLQALEDKGYSAYVVGGCVRDAILGLQPKDYDLCTSATPEQTAKVFSRHTLVRSGEKHGTIGVVLDGQVYEITTFRSEGTYTDNRHPDWVEFVGNVETDLARRDFTVNAIAYSPTQGHIDPSNGQQDLKYRILRTVGNPEERFREDALRILRGVRFAVRFGLSPEPETEKAMFRLASLMDNLAHERVFSELCEILLRINAEELIHFAPILTQAIPELAPAVGFDQHSPHHAYDVYTHTAYTVASVPAELPLRLAALLHDIGKPAVFSQDETGRGHFYDHAKVGAEMANDILLRLRAPNALRQQVVLLVEQHMTPLTPDKKILRRRLGAYGNDTVRQLLALQKADHAAKGVDEEEETNFILVEAALDALEQEDACLTVKDLAINGNDVLSLGVAPGPRIGECMTFLLGLVQDEIISNTEEALLQAAKEFFINNQEESQ